MADRSPRSFTEQVRQELGRLVPERRCDVRAELAGIAAIAGSLHLRGSDAGSRLHIEIATRSGAAARTAFALLQAETGGGGTGVRPEIRVHAAGGLRASSSYVVSVESDARRMGESIGLLDEDGRPRRAPPEEMISASCDRLAFVRGAVLAGGSISAPARAPHLEIAAGTRELAERIAAAVGDVAHHPCGVSRAPGGFRAVVKSGRAIGRLLGEVGATGAFLDWEEQRVRRQVRAVATRLANADAANVRRAVEAAAAQVRTVERAIDEIGWGGLAPELQEIALARLANPAASLAELGELCDPSITKSAAHRRLLRIESLLTDGRERLHDPGSGGPLRFD